VDELFLLERSRNKDLGSGIKTVGRKTGENFILHEYDFPSFNEMKGTIIIR